jgi:hypothetical protein
MQLFYYTTREEEKQTNEMVVTSQGASLNYYSFNNNVFYGC